MTRLQDIESLIPRETQVIADIGYDHGKLLDRLISSHPEAQLYGVEIQAEAATRYWSSRPDIATLKQRVRLIRGDGLSPLAHTAPRPEVVVFAGIGEGRIVEILQDSPEVVADLRRMVFAPEKPRAVLRPYIRSIGWSAVEERLSLLRNRFYQAFAAEKTRPGNFGPSCETGSESSSNPASNSSDHPFWLLGPDLFEQKHPLLKPYLRHLQEALARPSVPDGGRAPERTWLVEYRAAIRRALQPGTG